VCFFSKSSFKIRNIHLSFPRHVLFFHPEISLVICLGIIRNSGEKNLILISKYCLFSLFFLLCLFACFSLLFFSTPCIPVSSLKSLPTFFYPPAPVLSQQGRKRAQQQGWELGSSWASTWGMDQIWEELVRFSSKTAWFRAKFSTVVTSYWKCEKC